MMFKSTHQNGESTAGPVGQCASSGPMLLKNRDVRLCPLIAGMLDGASQPINPNPITDRSLRNQSRAKLHIVCCKWGANRADASSSYHYQIHLFIHCIDGHKLLPTSCYRKFMINGKHKFSFMNCSCNSNPQCNEWMNELQRNLCWLEYISLPG